MMIINLLPWRDKKREHDKKAAAIILSGAAIAAILLVMVVNLYMSHLINDQQGRNQILTHEIDELNNKIKDIKKLQIVRKNLISRMKIVYDLQKTRPLNVHLFDSIIHILPEGVYLTEIQRTGNVVMIIGHAGSNSDVSMMMKNIVGDPWIQAPVLTEIKKVSPDKLHSAEYNEFKLSFILQPDSAASNGTIKHQ